MAPMDVEKRMGLSLDAIIKQSGKGKPGGGRDKGRGKPRDKKLVIGQVCLLLCYSLITALSCSRWPFPSDNLRAY